MQFREAAEQILLQKVLNMEEKLTPPPPPPPPPLHLQLVDLKSNLCRIPARKGASLSTSFTLQI